MWCLITQETKKQTRLQNPHSTSKISSTDLKHFIKLYIFWTTILYSNKVNKPYNSHLKRSDQVQVIISRTCADHLKQQPECIFCDCPFSCDVINTLPTSNLLLNNLQSLQNLFIKVSTNDSLQFLQECDFCNKIFTVTFF